MGNRLETIFFTILLNFCLDDVLTYFYLCTHFFFTRLRSIALAGSPAFFQHRDAELLESVLSHLHRVLPSVFATAVVILYLLHAHLTPAPDVIQASETNASASVAVLLPLLRSSDSCPHLLRLLQLSTVTKIYI